MIALGLTVRISVSVSVRKISLTLMNIKCIVLLNIIWPIKKNMKEEISASFRSLRSTSPLLIVSETKIQNTTNIINKKSWTIYREDEYKD